MKLDWTHRKIKIIDIRKLKELYIIVVKEIDGKLSISDQIFEERIKSYFLNNDINMINRKDILDLKWNMYITKGYYIKINEKMTGNIVEFSGDPNRFYVSYLEIDGKLGTFQSIIK